MVEQGEAVLWDRGMLGIPQENGKSGPIKAWYIIRVLRSVEGHVNQPPDSQQPHPDAPVPLLGLWDAGLLVHHTQC